MKVLSLQRMTVRQDPVFAAASWTSSFSHCCQRNPVLT
ncbi:class III lanthipeptide [Thermus sp.]